MNKLSGYKEFTLASGEKLELKFGNGATEIFAQRMGFKTLEEVDKALFIEREEREVNGETIVVPLVTIDYLRNFRVFVFAAAEYAALAQNKPFTWNEWQASEWIEELGAERILGVIEEPAIAATTKKKDSKPLKVNP